MWSFFFVLDFVVLCFASCHSNYRIMCVHLLHRDLSWGNLPTARRSKSTLRWWDCEKTESTATTVSLNIGLFAVYFLMDSWKGGIFYHKSLVIKVLSLKEMESVTWFQILGKTVSLHANVLEKTWIHLFSPQLWVKNRTEWVSLAFVRQPI